MTAKVSAQDTIRTQTDAWNSRDAARIAAGYAAGVLGDRVLTTQRFWICRIVDYDAGDFFAAFPDSRVRIERAIGQGDTAVYEGTMTGTHTGALAFPTGLVPATNRPVELKIAGIITVDDTGIITSENRYYDVMGMLAQLGLLQ